MLKFRRTESMNVDVRILFSNVLQKINVPLEWQSRMVPALHQNLHSACGSEFIQLFIELLETKHVMIFVALRSIKRAELAVNITDVRVIDVAIDDVRHDLASTAAVTCRFCQITPGIR